MPEGEPTLPRYFPQGAGDGLVGAFLQQRRLQPVEQGELVGGRERRVVGNIVRRAHEIIKGENRRAVAPGDQE
jgi:hypothetical protein